jgi:hypothetical protein
MPTNSRAAVTLVDSLIILIVSGMLALTILWAGSQVWNGISFLQLPAWLSTASAKIWTYTTGSMSSLFLAALRRRHSAPTPNYLLWFGGTTIVMLTLVLMVGAVMPHQVQTEGWLRFSLQCEKSEHPILSFFQRQPKWKEAHPVAPNGDRYKDWVDLPRGGARFYARAKRVVTDSEFTEDLGSPTEFCFKQRPTPPPGNPPREAHLDCTEGKHCRVSDNDPGWFEDCSTAADWNTQTGILRTVYADEKPQPGWKVPSLETLRSMGGQDRPGYTEFTIRSSELGTLKADSVQYLIKANGQPLYVDGWGPEDMLTPFDGTNGFIFTFGLQNLDFSGADDGCEDIQVNLSFREQSRVIKQVTLSRKYAALRDTDSEDLRSADGTDFSWGGKYMKPKTEDTSEVIVASVPNLQAMKNAKNQIDEAKVTYDGATVVGVLRPPLNNPNYSIAVGVRQQSGQVRFTFDKATANHILDWTRHVPIRSTRLFRKDTFVYQMRPGDNGSGTFKSCSLPATGKP